MTKLRNYFLDFPNLLFATYSETGLAPARAQINIINDQTDYFSESTQFNILSSIDVRLAQALNYSKYSAVEMNISAYSFAIIIINRCNFNITNINVYRNVTLDRNLDVPFIIAIYEQINIVTITNMDFHISGRILTSNQPINLHVENVYMDFYGMMGGIYINADCNYPEASIIGNILVTNVTAENTQTRITPFLSGILYYAGPANVTVQYTNVLIYGSLLDGKSSIEIHSNKNCIPIDDEVQIITIQYNLFRLSLNPVNERFVETFIEITENYPRKIQTNILNNVINNIVYNVFPVFYCFFTSNSDIYITNNTITHVSSRQGIMAIDSMNSVTLRDTNVYNSTDFGHYLYYLSNVQNITLQSIKLENVTATGTTTDRMFLFDVINNGTIWIDLVYMKNVDIGLQPGFYFNGLLSKVSYTNMYFENISVGDNNRMITTGEFKTLEINNITFINTNGQYVSDTTNYMIYIDIINLNSATNSTISNIYVQSSTVNILKMQNVVGSALTPVCMNFRNITYRDSYVKLKQSFILYSNVESQEQFYTVFDQVTFSNVTLRSGGYLMDFGQQTLTQVVVSNLVFSNIYAGTIHLESSYKVLPYKTKVLIQNGKFENVNSNTESIFLLNEGAELEIRNSSFNQISCTESGGVIYSSYQFTVTSIYDSSFTNSSSVKAALFLIEDGGVIRLYRCSMVQNFAVSSTLMHASNNGYFEIYDSKITQNYGIINIVSEVINSINLCIIDNTKIYNNQFMTISDIFLEFTETCKLLCFVPSSLSSYIISNPSLYNFLIESKMFELISARLIIQNKSVIYNQLSIAKSFMSSLTFLDSTFYNLMIREKGIRIAESTINITDCTFYNISASDTTSFVDAGINTIVYLTNTTYSNCTCPFMVTSVATVTLDRITISNCYPHLECISILRAPFVSITNSSMNMAFSDNSTSPFRILDSKVNLIANTSINNLNQYAIYFSLCNVTTIDGLHVSNTFGIYLRNVNIDRITNSMFENNGKGYNSQDQLSTRGGAILSLSSNFTIDSSLFYNNTSKYGAGVFISCQLSPICITAISNTTFERNTAQLSGGGIMYDLYRPTLSNLVFSSNSALYGPNIASYAVKVNIGNETINSITINNAVSGQISRTYIFSIVDYDNQIMNLDPNLKVTIRPVTPGAQLFGRNIYFADAGVAKMNETMFIFSPGSANIVYSISPSTINLDKAKAVYGANYTLPTIVANFRYCKPGEYFYSNQCLSCSGGSYSLFWNSTLCSQCMGNVNCLGDEVINIDAGFWRKSTNSTLIIECPNKDACKGGYNTTNTYPVNCATGYRGVLCAKCIMVGENKYEKVSNFQCTKCASPMIIYIRMIGMATAFILAILFIVYLKRKEGNERTVLMRIMANYVQIMTTTLAYNMNLPNVISEAFTPLKALGSGTTTVFSMDCFSSTSEFKLFTPSSTIFKMFMMALTPLLLCGIISIILCTVALVTRASFKDFK